MSAHPKIDLLELLDLFLDLLHDRQVLIDDEVHQRVEDVARPLREQMRRGFAALPDADMRAQRAVAHGDEVVAPEEDVGLAELEVARRGGHVRRAQNDEQRILVQLELRPLMRVVGVFDREVVQSELLLHLPQHILFGLVEAEPDELIVAGQRRLRI